MPVDVAEPDSLPPPQDVALTIRDRLALGCLSTLTFVFERVAIDRVIALGAAFGRGRVRLGGPRTDRVRSQLKSAFSDRDVALRETWTRDVFVHLGRGLAELVLLGGGHRQALLDRVEVTGLEHVVASEDLTASGGALIVTAHFGNWELACAKVAALGIPISVVYRSLRRPAADRALFSLRARGSTEVHPGTATLEQIPMGRAGIRVVRALEAGRKVLVLLDQDARREEGVFVPFFGRLASTRYGPIALAVERGIPVLTAFARREPDGRTHRLEIQPVLQLEQGMSDNEEVLRRNVEKVTAVIEKEIRTCPGQWIWTHRRWRTQPKPADVVTLADQN